MKTWIFNAVLAVALICAAINIVWIILLKDYSYAALTAQISLFGAIAWVFVSFVQWRWWYLLMVPALAIPFLPWVDWMYD